MLFYEAQIKIGANGEYPWGRHSKKGDVHKIISFSTVPPRYRVQGARYREESLKSLESRLASGP